MAVVRFGVRQTEWTELNHAEPMPGDSGGLWKALETVLTDEEWRCVSIRRNPQGDIEVVVDPTAKGAQDNTASMVRYTVEKYYHDHG